MPRGIRQIAVASARSRELRPGVLVTRGGAVPKTLPVGWVLLDGDYTIRWRRGEPVAHLLEGAQVGSHGLVGVVDTVPVPPAGWVDLAEIRQVGQRWRRQQRSPQRRVGARQVRVGAR